ncbi:MAG: TatD family hydrolase [Deltaproteobacteria bacterium]|nr:TatD family hydrolase [Deltaproteobacteria bacterium]
MALFDVHAHLTHPKLADALPTVIANARTAGLSTIVSNGLNPEDNEATRALAAEHPDLIRPAFGLYPVDAVMPELLATGVDYPRTPSNYTPDDAVQWVRENADEAIAVGEVGLDGYWVPEGLWDIQETRFRALVQIAIDRDKPLIIHTRKRERRAFEILSEMGAARVDWHCFGGRVKLARRIASELGHFFSIPANARRSQSFTRMLETLPRESVLLETDCPYLAPEPGSTNEPSNVAGTAAYAAEVWEVPLEAAQEQLESNFERLFGVRP